MSQKHTTSLTEQALKSLLPGNRLHESCKLTNEESIKINNKIKRDKAHKIKNTDKYLVICIKGKCKDELNLWRPKTMKASNWSSKHLQNFHEAEERINLDKEILLHSYFTVTGTKNKKQYNNHYLLIEVTGGKRFKYIKPNNPFNGIFNPNINTTIRKYKCYDEIDLEVTQSSKCMYTIYYKNKCFLYTNRL